MLKKSEQIKIPVKNLNSRGTNDYAGSKALTLYLIAM